MSRPRAWSRLGSTPIYLSLRAIFIDCSSSFSLFLLPVPPPFLHFLFLSFSSSDFSSSDLDFYSDSYVFLCDFPVFRLILIYFWFFFGIFDPLIPVILPILMINYDVSNSYQFDIDNYDYYYSSDSNSDYDSENIFIWDSLSHDLRHSAHFIEPLSPSKISAKTCHAKLYVIFAILRDCIYTLDEIWLRGRHIQTCNQVDTWRDRQILCTEPTLSMGLTRFEWQIS